MFCKTCGTELPDGAAFCAACGEKLQGGIGCSGEGAPAALEAVDGTAKGKGDGSAMKVALVGVAIMGLIILALTQFHVCDYCGASFFGKSYRAYGYDFLCADCGSRNAPFVVENDFLTI